MKKTLLTAAALLMAGTLSASAGETGLASIHDLRKETGTTCMSGHFHEGNGNGATRKAAEASAAKAWAMFVELEYGSDWAHHSYARGKTMNCKPQTGFWSCDTSARPCLRHSGAVKSAYSLRARSRHRVKLAKVPAQRQQVKDDPVTSASITTK
jgi:hypothetical protein